MSDRSNFLNKLSKVEFWGQYFDLFIEMVHIAEFAHKRSGGYGNQSELAFSACFQRVLIEHLKRLNITDWFPAIEVPYATVNKKLNRVDVSLFPWDLSLDQDPAKKATWEICSNPEKHIRIELKWLDINNPRFKKYFNLYDEIHHMIFKENEHTDKDFMIALFFHGETWSPKEDIEKNKQYEDQMKNWKFVYYDKKLRDEFKKHGLKPEYSHFSLIVCAKRS
jgi:hypothetical protein